MNKLILSLLLLSLSIFTNAAEQSFSLTLGAPLTRVDGTLLPAIEIASYKICYSITDQGLPITPPEDESCIVVVNGTSVDISSTLDPRIAPYQFNVVALTIDTDGLRSIFSKVLSDVFVVKSTSEPNAPTILQFSVTCSMGCSIEEKK